MPQTRATLASKKRALELGAGYIELELSRMRDSIANRKDAPDGWSVEADVMKAMEWGSAWATLKMMAEVEDK